MRTMLAGNQAALSAARDKGIVPRDFFWIEARDRATGAAVTRGLWSGDRTITVDVPSGKTGLLETRTYYGGVNLKVGNIARVSDLTIQSVDVSFSAIAAVTQEIVRGFNTHLARVEIHAGLLDPATRALAAAPEIDFLGLVDGAPIGTPARGGEALITLSVASEAIAMLQRTNPRKRSYEGQKARQGDEFGLYSSTIRNWTIYWGENPPT